jgi:hypothetical protein
VSDNPFYRTTTGNLNLYGDSTSGTEPDMREEFINTMDGSSPEIAKGQVGLLRKMRRTSDGSLIPCGCVHNITKEPDKDRFCPICFGEGYLWDEASIKFYRVYKESDAANVEKDQLRKPGLINQPFVVFYVRYDAEITKQDKIVEIELNDDGTASDPMRRKRLFRIGNLWDYRADNGKLEYFKVFTYHEDVKHLNAPTYGDV